LDFYFGQVPFERRAFDMDRFRAAYGAAHDPDDLLGQFCLLGFLLFEKLLFCDRRTPRGQWAIERAGEILQQIERQT
jgi:hypothetical protein